MNDRRTLAAESTRPGQFSGADGDSFICWRRTPDAMLTSRSQIRVRYAETDMMGIAYHANYLPWLEIGRTDLLRENGFPYAELERMGFRLPVLEVNVRYLRPALYDDVITVETILTEKPTVRIRLDYRITRDATLLATAQTAHAFLNHQNEPVKPPPEFLAAVNQWFPLGG